MRRRKKDLVELYGLAAKVGPSDLEITDWGFRVGDLHNIGGDADGLQSIIAEAKRASAQLTELLSHP
jgi:hypothetical protein